MMIATYKRDRNLPPLLKHLTTDPPPSLRQIVIIWQNIGSDLPEALSPAALADYSASGVNVTVRLSQKNSMNERFRPLVDWDEPVRTRAVMIMDDDIVLRRETLEWGYREFVAANEVGAGRLVGFTGRDFDEAEDGWSYNVRPKETYSMVLSNAAWLRREWLDQYWSKTAEMQSLRDYVDQVFNCDDILINYIVSNMTGNPPLLLQPKTPLRIIGGDGMFARGSVAVTDDGEDETVADDETAKADGIPTASHFEQRKLCLAHYFAHFAPFAPSSESASRHFPLVKTRTSVSQDVEDHSRWLFNNEPWEPITGWKLVEPAMQAPPLANLDLVEEDDPAEVDYEAMLEGLSEEEIDDLLRELELQDGPPSDGEEGLGEFDEQASVFQEVESDDEDDEEHGGLWHRPIERDEL